MAYIKTRYRKLATGGAVTSPAPAVDDVVMAAAPSLAPPILDKPTPPAPSASAIHDAFLDQCRQHGVPDHTIEFLKQHPALIENPELLAEAANEAQDHHEVYSPEFNQACLSGVNDRLNRPYSSQRTPPAGEVFESANSRIVLDAPKKQSADLPSMRPERINDTIAGRYWSGQSADPRSVSINLSRDQKEAAVLSGVSFEEYARQLIKLREFKARGEYGGSP